MWQVADWQRFLQVFCCAFNESGLQVAAWSAQCNPLWRAHGVNPSWLLLSILQHPYYPYYIFALFMLLLSLVSDFVLVPHDGDGRLWTLSACLHFSLQSGVGCCALLGLWERQQGGMIVAWCTQVYLRCLINLKMTTGPMRQTPSMLITYNSKSEARRFAVCWCRCSCVLSAPQRSCSHSKGVSPVSLFQGSPCSVARFCYCVARHPRASPNSRIKDVFGPYLYPYLQLKFDPANGLFGKQTLADTCWWFSEKTGVQPTDFFIWGHRL